jgi:hypothetical protein
LPSDTSGVARKISLPDPSNSGAIKPAAPTERYQSPCIQSKKPFFSWALAEPVNAITNAEEASSMILRKTLKTNARMKAYLLRSSR